MFRYSRGLDAGTTEQIKPRCAACDEGRFRYSRGLDTGTTEQIKPRCAACDEGRLRYTGSTGLDTGTTLNRSNLGVLLVMRGGLDIVEV